MTIAPKSPQECFDRLHEIDNEELMAGEIGFTMAYCEKDLREALASYTLWLKRQLGVFRPNPNHDDTFKYGVERGVFEVQRFLDAQIEELSG